MLQKTLMILGIVLITIVLVSMAVLVLSGVFTVWVVGDYVNDVAATQAAYSTSYFATETALQAAWEATSMKYDYCERFPGLDYYDCLNGTSTPVVPFPFLTYDEYQQTMQVTPTPGQ